MTPGTSSAVTSPGTPHPAQPQGGIGFWVHLEQAAPVHSRLWGRGCLSTTEGDTECPKLGVRAEAALAWGTHVGASKSP